MNKTLLALYGLKFNPFSPELPTEALHITPPVEQFCWRIEQALIREGGFALVQGDPGTGKSVVLRLLAERLAQLPDISVGAIAHPSSNLADFYREMGDLFAVELKPHRRVGTPLRRKIEIAATDGHRLAVVRAKAPEGQPHGSEVTVADLGSHDRGRPGSGARRPSRLPSGPRPIHTRSPEAASRSRSATTSRSRTTSRSTRAP